MRTRLAVMLGDEAVDPLEQTGEGRQIGVTGQREDSDAVDVVVGEAKVHGCRDATGWPGRQPGRRR